MAEAKRAKVIEGAERDQHLAALKATGEQMGRPSFSGNCHWSQPTKLAKTTTSQGHSLGS